MRADLTGALKFCWSCCEAFVLFLFTLNNPVIIVALRMLRLGGGPGGARLHPAGYKRKTKKKVAFSINCLSLLHIRKEFPVKVFSR